MKILNKIWGVSLLALLLIVAAPHISKAQDEYISEQDFYDELAPYGTWVSDPQCGDVWIPDVAGDFRPYQTQGHWVLTEYGNTWVSEYPWGWATFHYGRWRYDDYYGWEWIPGYEWAPAWVSWRHGGGYYGWAPLTPGVSIDLSFGSNYRVPDSYWAFAPEAYINRPNIYNYYVPHTRVVNIIRNTTVINNTYYNGGRRYIAGPRAADIQRYTHQRPRVYSINNASRPGTINVQNNTVNIFRPAVRRTGDARPQRVVDANAYKQQNPNQGIARRGPGGAPGFNHENAARLANVARNANDNNNVVRVNNRPNYDQQGRRPDQQQNNRSNVQTVTQPAQNQPDNRPVFTPNRGGRIQDRPNAGQPTQTPPAQTQAGQQPVFNRGSGRNDNDNRPATNQPNNDLQQKQQQLNDERRTVREQRRQQYQREQQLQSVGQTQQGPAINGQTPLQQQQMAIRDQQRQLREQQRQQAQQQAAQQQQAQRAQQQQAQQQAAQQQAQQAAQQQQAQREQQRQAAQQALQQQQSQQRGQAQQQAEQQQRAQREQQRQAQQQQQAQQLEQQRQAQQAARQQQQQAQQEQRAQQQQQQPQRQQRRPPEPPVRPVN